MKYILRRVPISFSWPLHQRWKGFINEHEGLAEDCPECHGSGLSAAARRLEEMWYSDESFRPEVRGSVPLKPTDPHVRVRATLLVRSSPSYYGSGDAAIDREATRLCSLWNKSWSHHLNADDVAALLAEDRLWDFTREFIPGKGNVPKESYEVPTPEQVNVWSIETSGHDGSNCWICCKAECKRLGVSFECEHCENGKVWPSPEVKAACDAWLSTEPPAGDGYQMWSTEGYPVTPVFANADGMTAWLEENELGAN